MKEIKELIKNRLKEVLTVPYKDDVDEQLRSHAVKTYISSIIMIDDYMKEEQGIEALKELGIKVDVDYLNIRRD